MKSIKEEVKKLRRFFREAYKIRSNNSPFAIPRADELEQAVSEGRCSYYTDGEDEDGSAKIIAALIFSDLKSDSTHQDFAQRKLKLKANTRRVSHLTSLDGQESAATTLLTLRAMSPYFKGRVVVELYEEHVALRNALMTLGFHYVATKISAYAEVVGVYANADAFAAMHSVGYIDSEEATLEVLQEVFLSTTELDEIRSELQLFTADFANHYSKYNKGESWSAFALQGYSKDPTVIHKPSEMSRKWKRENVIELTEARLQETTAFEHFPTVRAVIEGLGFRCQRIRFMRLKAGGGSLERHCDIQDKEAGVADTYISRLHIPIITNDAVFFETWDARGNHSATHMPQSSLCYLDMRKPHRARNDGDADRVHLVFDVFSNYDLRAILGDKLNRHSVKDTLFDEVESVVPYDVGDRT